MTTIVIDTLQTLQTILATAEPSSTLQLVNDITINTQLDFAEDLTLDLNTHTLTIEVTRGINVIDKHFTIINGNILASADQGITVSGATHPKAKLTLGTGLVVTQTATSLYCKTKGTLEVIGATIETNNKLASITLQYTGAQLLLNGAKITSLGDPVLKLHPNTTAIIQDSIIKGDNIVIDASGATIEVLGGSLTSTYGAIFNLENTTLTLSHPELEAIESDIANYTGSRFSGDLDSMTLPEGKMLRNIDNIYNEITDLIVKYDGEVSENEDGYEIPHGDITPAETITTHTPITIYQAPTEKAMKHDHVGVLIITGPSVTNHSNMYTYIPVKYKLSGIGTWATGFIRKEREVNNG